MKKTLLTICLLFLLTLKIFSQTGQPDPSFGIDGYITHDIGGKVTYVEALIASDDKILLYGCTWTDTNWYDIFVARFNEDGSIDSTYGTDGATIIDIDEDYDWLWEAILLPDDHLLAVGESLQLAGYEFDLLLTKFKPDGQLDSTFGSDGIVLYDFEDRDVGYDVLIQNDSLILVAGMAQSFQEDMVLRRFKPDGSIDSSFGVDGSVIVDYAGLEGFTQVEVLDDGKILVSGEETAWADGPVDVFFARFHPDGAIDSSWGDNGTSLLDFEDNDFPMSFRVLEDQKILVTAATPAFGLSDQGTGIARLLPDGSLDSSFAMDGKLQFNIGEVDWSRQTHLLPDDRFVVVGDTYTGTAPPLTKQVYLACFLPDGTFDTSFADSGIAVHTYDTAFAASYYNSSQMLQDGKILFAGIKKLDSPDSRILLARFFGHELTSAIYSPEVSPGSLIQLEVFPNPVRSTFQVSLQLSTSSQLRMSIHGLLGNYEQVIFNDRQFAAGTHTIQVSMPSDLPEGIYVISINDNYKSASAILKYLE